MRTSPRIGVLAVSLVGVACAAAAPARPPLASSPAAAVPPASTAAVAACDTPEHHQLDFWLGDWDLVVRARKAPDRDEWAEAKGTQHIEKILGGCVVAEHFAAEGPDQPWAGKSHSVWVPALGKWRQTWVDDQGGYLAFVGGLEDGVLALYGEPREREGQTVLMRMVFLDVTADAMRWEWQRTTDDGATWTPMLIIDYRRRAP